MATKKKKKELKDQSIKSLQEAAAQLDREIFVIRNELSWNRKLEKPHRLKEKRKSKARILTMLTMKQRSQTNVKEA
jgi:large subunit ribosomal protein L29